MDNTPSIDAKLEGGLSPALRQPTAETPADPPNGCLPSATTELPAQQTDPTADLDGDWELDPVLELAVDTCKVLRELTYSDCLDELELNNDLTAPVANRDLSEAIAKDSMDNDDGQSSSTDTDEVVHTEDVDVKPTVVTAAKNLSDDTKQAELEVMQSLERLEQLSWEDNTTEREKDELPGVVESFVLDYDSKTMTDA